MAVTSNIHYNLTAWASGSFFAGNRRSTGGNAYQCVTSGTSTVAPTGSGSSINNGGTAVWKWLSAIDYTSLAAWSASIPSTLTQPYVALVWNNGTITTTSGVPWLSLTGHTTTASNSITITPAPGEDFVSATPSGPTGWLATANVQVSGTTISLSGTADGNTVYPFYGNTRLLQPCYWELLVVAPTSTSGFSAGLSPMGGSATDIGPVLQWHEDGSLWSDGGFDNLGGPGTWPAYASGDLICLAFDPVHNTVWGRKGASGNWNNSGTANPATNTGGLAVPASILAAGVVIGGTLYQNNNTVTANFTSATFVGTPPSGFGPIRTHPLAFNASAGVNFVAPATGVGNANYFSIADSFVVLDHIQFQDPNATSGSSLIQASNGITIQNCIIDGYSQPSGASIIQAASGGTTTGTFKFINNLLVDRSAGAGAITVNSNYNTVYANNTIVAINSPAGLLGLLNQGASGVSTSSTNNIIIGYPAATTIGSNHGATTSAQYSLFSSGTLTGGVTLGSGNVFNASAASQFISTTTNFRLLSTSGAVDTGLTDTADVPSATDIFGQVRPQGSAWDMGAAEYMAANSVGTSTITFTAPGTSATASRGIGASGITFTVSGSANTRTGAGTSGITFAASGVGQAPSFGTSSITFAASAYDASGAISAVIAIDPIPVQRPDTAFIVTGTYSLVPDLQFSDDAGAVFTQIPEADASPLGEVSFSFVHPGVSTGGTQTLVVSDTSTGDAGTTSYLVQAEAPKFASAFPPSAQTTTQGIIPSYLYEEYNDDDNLWALVNSYNALAQGYLDWFNNINLPVYTGDQISGPLLDWVATGIYGLPRPTLSYSTGLPSVGPFNTYPLDSIAFDDGNTAVATTVFNVTDDIYKRILTWCFYKGDGFVFTVRWLKRRVVRFLAGTNGTDPSVNQTYQISVKYTGTTVVNITISSGTAPTTYAPVLRAAILSGVLPLPFQYTYNILIS